MQHTPKWNYKGHNLWNFICRTWDISGGNLSFNCTVLKIP